MSKSPDAFRTISEVADWLGIQAHVLRFWESKFTQVKPIKRAGGRRYYRPADMLLLGGIQKLLHDDGLTIKGVQKLLREEGMSYVSALSPPLDDAEGAIDAPVSKAAVKKPVTQPEKKSVVLPFEAPKDSVVEAGEPESKPDQQAPDAQATDKQESQGQDEDTPQPIEDAPAPLEPEPVEAEAKAEVIEASTPEAQGAEEAPASLEEQTLEKEAKPESEGVVEAPADEPKETLSEETEVKKAEAAEAEIDEAKSLPSFLRSSEEDTPKETQTADIPAPESDTQNVDAAPETDAVDQAPVEVTAQKAPVAEPSEPEPQETTAPPAAPKARDIGMPTLTPEHEIHAEKSALTHAFRTRAFDAKTAQKLQPLLTQLAGLRDRMAAGHGSGQPKS